MIDDFIVALGVGNLHRNTEWNMHTLQMQRYAESQVKPDSMPSMTNASLDPEPLAGLPITVSFQFTG
jgi:hypothetical protein